MGLKGCIFNSLTNQNSLFWNFFHFHLLAFSIHIYTLYQAHLTNIIYFMYNINCSIGYILLKKIRQHVKTFVFNQTESIMMNLKFILKLFEECVF